MNRILIEGLDLTGKSTLAKGLVALDSNTFIYQKSLYSSNNELYHETVKASKTLNYSENVIAWMYIASAQLELDLCKELKDSNQTVIQDSFFLNRMIGYHGVKNKEYLINVIKYYINQFEKPIQTFYLYTDIETKQKRFKERLKEKKPAIGDKLIFEDKSLHEKREQIFREFIMETYNAEFIDTSYLDKNELTDIVYTRIRRKE